MKKLISIIFIITVLNGCGVKEDIVRKISAPESQHEKIVNAVWANCKRPEKLTQNCDSWQGANKVIQIADYRMRISATVDGKIILIMADKDECSGSDPRCVTDSNNRNYILLTSLFKKNGFEVEKVAVVATNFWVSGYYIYLNEDGYSILNKFTVNE